MLGCPPVESEGEIGILLNVYNGLVVTGILAWDREACQVIVHRDVYFKHFKLFLTQSRAWPWKCEVNSVSSFVPPKDSKRWNRLDDWDSRRNVQYLQGLLICPRLLSQYNLHLKSFKDPLVAYWLIHVPLHFGNGTGARNQVSPRFPCSQETQPIMAKKGDLNAWEIQPKLGRGFSAFFFFSVGSVGHTKKWKNFHDFSSTCQYYVYNFLYACYTLYKFKKTYISRMIFLDPTSDTSNKKNLDLWHSQKQQTTSPPHRVLPAFPKNRCAEEKTLELWSFQRRRVSLSKVKKSGPRRGFPWMTLVLVYPPETCWKAMHKVAKMRYQDWWGSIDIINDSTDQIQEHSRQEMVIYETFWFRWLHQIMSMESPLWNRHFRSKGFFLKGQRWFYLVAARDFIPQVNL